MLALSFHFFSSDFHWERVSLAPIPVGTLVQITRPTVPPKLFTDRTILFGEVGSVAQYDNNLYQVENMNGVLIAHLPFSDLKVIGDGIELIQAPFQACSHLLEEHRSYISQAFQPRITHKNEEPVRFIHIGQEHSHHALKNSYNIEIKSSICASQINIYKKLMDLRRQHPDMLIFHEQFMFLQQSEPQFLLQLINGNKELTKKSSAFEQALQKKYRKFFRAKDINQKLFNCFSRELENFFEDVTEQINWKKWYTKLLDMKRPETSRALYLFQNEKHSHIRERFRPTNIEDKSQLITMNLYALLENGFELLKEKLNKENFSSVLSLLRKDPWSASIQDLAKKAFKAVIKTDQDLKEIFETFRKQVTEEFEMSFIQLFREEEALRQVNKYVFLEKPKVVVFVYGLAHDIETRAEQYLNFNFSYEYISTSPNETDIFLTPIEEISQKELSGKPLTPQEAISKRRWMHMRPNFFLENKAKLENAYLDFIKNK